jgi:hypothetical protein
MQQLSNDDCCNSDGIGNLTVKTGEKKLLNHACATKKKKTQKHFAFQKEKEDEEAKNRNASEKW